MTEERAARLDLLSRWEASRETRAVVLATRPDAGLRMGECVRYLYEHFRELPQRPLDRIDLVLIGSGLTPEIGARVAALLREYARELTVVVTGSVGPGETLASIAADVVLMHPMATLTTALPSSGESGESTGLNSLVAHLLAKGDAADPAYGPMLQRTDAALVGDAIHRVEWVEHQIRQLASGRLAPPKPAALAELVQTLTRRVQRAGEPVDRRAARALAALPVQIPNPDIEAAAFDLHIAYESLLGLLQPDAPHVPRALIESTASLHSLLRVDGDETAGAHAQWQRHFDAPVH